MTDQAPLRSVVVEYADEHWWVIIVEHGDEYRQSFESQEHAESFAAGHRIRLGLEDPR